MERSRYITADEAKDGLSFYYHAHRARTITSLVQHWAPALDGNDTPRLIDAVSTHLGLSSESDPDLDNPNNMTAFIRALDANGLMWRRS